MSARRALSTITGDATFARAAGNYTREFLALCQSPETGLLAWGEHPCYDVFRDRVAVERIHHEFLGATSPWTELWASDADATARGIADVRHHFSSSTPESYLFNRHTPWLALAPAFQAAGQPWIKHTGLQAYSFAFLYSKTRDERWLPWLRGTAELYWDHCNRQTDLTLGCLGDPREQAQQSTPGRRSLLRGESRSVARPILLQSENIDPVTQLCGRCRPARYWREEASRAFRSGRASCIT